MKTFNIDTDTPLIPEIIAEGVTHDREQATRLSERARRHWRDSKGFRASFKRQDPRAQLKTWMDHWKQGEDIRAKP